MHAVIPAVLAHTKRELREQLARLAGVPVVQIDVVDGEFAAPATWPYSAGSTAPVDVPELVGHRFEVDLMVKEPERVIGAWLALGASRLTLHVESMKEPSKTLARIKSAYGHESGGIKSFALGLAINTQTDLAELEEHLAHIDYVQLMGIDVIGKQGQPFNEATIERVRALRAVHPLLVIQIDGGVSERNAPTLVAAGADRLVVGHAITLAREPIVAVRSFEKILATPARYTGDMPVSDADLTALYEKATEIRRTIIEMLVAAGSGHTAGPLGMADIFSALYFYILRHNPQDPEWEGRDRLVLSNGHICPVRYAAMAHAGYFPVEECLTLRRFGSRLQGHPERTKLPGLETTSGPLGEGLGQAAGMAYAFKMWDIRYPTSDVGYRISHTSRMSHIRPRVYCVVSDGEQDEGNTWEAAMFAGKNRLHNLTAIMDRNNIQIDGMTEDVMPLEPIADKYRAFNWHVIECSGHDLAAFIAAVEEAKAVYEKPTMIIAHTIPGKGVKEIEFDYRWHGVPPGAGPEDVWPKAEQGKAMLAELRTLGGRITGEHQ